MKDKTVLYVSPAGDDAGDGSKQRPFRTPAAARDEIRRRRARGELVGPVTVYLRGGTYFLPETLVLTPEDSGTTDCPVTWAAWRGEKPVLSGGRPIAGWRRDQRGRWTVELGEAGEGKWSFRQLFVGGQRRNRPRLPKEGFYRIAELPGANFKEIPWKDPADRFVYANEDIKASWRNLQDVEVVALHFWVDVHLPVAAVDEQARLVTFTRRSRRRLTDDFSKQGARYYVENVAEVLDDSPEPGLWYLDRKTGVLTYVPHAHEAESLPEVIAPRLTHVLRLEGQAEAGRFVEHVAFRGLTFSHTEYELPPDNAGDLQSANTVPGAVHLAGVRHCAVRDCTFRHLGTYGLEIAEGCRHVAVTGNELADLGGGGVKISGSDAAGPEHARTSACRVTDNHMHDLGRVWHSAAGVLLRHASGCTISRNHIHHLYYTGVSVGWVWGYGPSVSRDNRVEFNHIHHVGEGLLSDMGGIYTLGVSPGTVIRGNLIHDVESHGYGGWGIYTDEGSSGIRIENNVVCRTRTGGFHQHYGRKNTIRNNVFAFARTGQIQRTRAEPHLSFTFRNNIVLWAEGPLLHGQWQDGKYRFDRNVYFRTGGDVDFAGKGLAEWQAAGQDRHSIVADPLLVDPENGDFTLKPDSPALKLGFKPIDLSRVGPRRRAKP